NATGRCVAALSIPPSAARFRSGSSGSTISSRSTGNPALAKWAAIRAPMVPAPKTATRRNGFITASVHQSRTGLPACPAGNGLLNPASYDEGVTDSPRRIPGWLPQVLGYSVSAACLIWVLHGYPLDELGPALRALDYRWVALAVVADLAGYVVHGRAGAP